MKEYIGALILLIAGCSLVFGGGQAEAASVERGEYLAAKGIIIPPEEIFEDSYVAAVDYQYPDPEESFGIRFYSGHRQLSAAGQEEIFLIAIQGRRPTYEDLPIMNHVFVIDKSGSMYQTDKIDWMKESFDAFMSTVRRKDYVSVVVFDDSARVLFPSTKMSSDNVKRRMTEAVHALAPGGGSNVQSALQLAYKEILSNYQKDGVNRVLFLSDGVGDVEGIYGIADIYREIGVNVTTIGMGEDADLDFLRNLADRAGGGSRFLSSREKIAEIFGPDFIRMVMPAARNIELKLHLLENLQNVKTWGYHSKIEGLWDRYAQTGKEVPYGLSADSAGVVYVADDANNRIQKFNNAGDLLAQWGRSGTRSWDEDEKDVMEGRFSHPRGITVDARGQVYVADSRNHRIQKFTADGAFLLQWGGPGSTAGKFQQPTDVAVDSRGYLYVADSANHRIQKFDREGNFITQWGGKGSENGRFNKPVGLAVDAYRNVYVADSGNQRIQIFESDGTFIAAVSSTESHFVPVGVAVDRNGNIFIADSAGGKLWKFGMDRARRTGWGPKGAKNATFGSIAAVAVDNEGCVLAADTEGGIQKFDGEGNFMIRQPLSFFIPTINLGDYETIVIQATIPKQDASGIKTIARLTGTYTDNSGHPVTIDPVDLTAKIVPQDVPVSGISNATVLRAATVLHYAQALKQIGLYYHHLGNVRAAVELAQRTKNELGNAQIRLGEQSLSGEIAILEKYVSIMSPEANLTVEQTRQLAADAEMPPEGKDRSLQEHIDLLFEEITLDLQARAEGGIAITGFSLSDGRSAKLLDILNSGAESALVNLGGRALISPERVSTILSDNNIEPSDLMETNTAIEVGKLLAATHILTGTVIEMSGSIAVFCRIIDVQSGTIASVGQVIIPKSSEVNALL